MAEGEPRPALTLRELLERIKRAKDARPAFQKEIAKRLQARGIPYPNPRREA